MEVSREHFDRVVHERNVLAKENERYRQKDQREKSAALEMTEKVVVGASAFAAGAGLGILNAQNSATAESPYMVGGSVAADAVGAAAGAVAILATPTRGPNSSLLPLAMGAGAGFIACFGQRMGYSYWQGRSGTSTTPSASNTSAASTSGYVGWGGTMAPRMGAPGHYGPRSNAYVARVAR